MTGTGCSISGRNLRPRPPAGPSTCVHWIRRIPYLARWHALLLERMGREIEGIRPRVLREETLRLLDELRRFRHGFRTLYRFDLDPERVAQVRRDAFRLEPLLEADLQRFLEFLTRMSAEIP